VWPRPLYLRGMGIGPGPLARPASRGPIAGLPMCNETVSIFVRLTERRGRRASMRGFNRRKLEMSVAASRRRKRLRDARPMPRSSRMPSA
jgi:hypothetical protein